MFDLCSDRLLDCDERFAGRNGHRFVEIWNCEEGLRPIYRSGELKEKEIAGWVDEERSATGPVRSGLRVLLSPKPSSAGKPSSGKLPFTKQTFLSLAQGWRIPSTFLRAIAQKLSIVTQCSVAPPPPRSQKSSPITPIFPQDELSERSSKISDQAHCLLVRGDVDWTWDYTLLLTYDPTTSTTYVLIVGLTATEIDLVISYLTHLSTQSIQPTPSLATHPLLLPIILLDLAADETSSLLKLRIKLLGQIQQRTGMDRFNSLKSATIAGEKKGGKSLEESRQDLDLDAIMLRLTCLSDWVAAQRGFVEIQRRAIDIVTSMFNQTDKFENQTASRLFDERLNFVRETLLAAEHKCLYLERSISAQVQTIYSLIGQKDNRLSLSFTSLSSKIASDSRRIAILTRRDSTDMRIIAAVTLIFLPGTFVATVFSTGLFDWGHGDPTPNPSADGGGEDRMVSKYIWVYFMLTGVLTFVVLTAWIVFSWCQNRRLMRQFGDGTDLEEGSANAEKRRDTETTLVDSDERLGRKTWAMSDFERWKEEAKGSLKWWRRRSDGDLVRIEQLKNA